MRLNDSRSMSSFSGGILVGLLPSSLTIVSKFCSLCQHGWSDSSFISCETPCTWELESSNSESRWFCNWHSRCNARALPVPGSLRYIHSNKLSTNCTKRLAVRGKIFFGSILGVTSLAESSERNYQIMNHLSIMAHEQLFYLEEKTTTTPNITKMVTMQ